MQDIDKFVIKVAIWIGVGTCTVTLAGFWLFDVFGK